MPTQPPSNNPQETFDLNISVAQEDLGDVIVALENYAAATGGPYGRRLEKIAFEWLLQAFRRYPLSPEMMQSVIARIRAKVSNGESVSRGQVALSGYFERQLARAK